jgi:hypothetical protein
MLNALWWLFSPTYRHWNTKQAAYRQIRKIIGDSDMTSAQAIALAASNANPQLRGLITQWRRQETTLIGD